MKLASELILKKFRNEFNLIIDKFVIIEEPLKELRSSNSDYIYNPGVYIHHTKHQIIKVGRHLTNSRKRALEHISDNTKNDKFEMKELINIQDASVTLINVKSPKDYHWVATIEIFMENNLNPIISSKRH